MLTLSKHFFSKYDRGLLVFIFCCFSSFTYATSHADKSLPTVALIQSVIVQPSYTNQSTPPSNESLDGLGILVNANPPIILTSSSLTQNAKLIGVRLVSKDEPSQLLIGHSIYTDLETDLSLLRIDNSENEDFSIQPVIMGDDAPNHQSLNIFSVFQKGLVHHPAELILTQASKYRQTPHFRSEEDTFLTHYISNPIKTNFNGEFLPAGSPVLDQNNRLVGISLSRQKSRENLIKIIPSPIIKKFILNASSSMSGLPNFGAKIEPTTRDLLNHLRCPFNHGVFVSDVYPNLPADKAGIQKGDIITDIDGYPISNNGTYPDPIFGNIHLQHLIRAKTSQGILHEITVIRNGTSKKIKLPSFHRPTKLDLIPDVTSTQPMLYFIFGGAVFIEANTSYFLNIHKKNIPASLGIYNKCANQTNAEYNWRRHVVYISNIFEVKGLRKPEKFEPMEVFEINDQPILDIRDVKSAFNNPLLIGQKSVHKIRTNFGFLFINKDSAMNAIQELQDTYQVNQYTNIED